MENNYDALNIIFKINNNEEKEKLLKFSYDYYISNGKDIEKAMISGWNSYITLRGVTRRYLSTPSEEFIIEVNKLFKSVRRKKLIGGLLNK